ncbi:unnamed protein product, partial [Gongylonema pulchrum]|uniref:receptor protein-tyrosine kinase n=1 Tax=Gongylonema pulchrum TaxID=637853 RepID=A0A183DWQ1_9BILA
GFCSERDRWKKRGTRDRRSITEDYSDPDEEQQYGDHKTILVTKNETKESISLYQADVDTEIHKINVTTRNLTIVDLRHYTQYQIWVYACQNVSAPDGSCSHRPGWLIVRTAPIPSYDLVDNRTIEVINATISKDDARSRKITWKEPLQPNGIVLAYRVTVVAEDQAQVILLIIGIVIIILVICAIAIRLTFKKIMGEKIREIHQQISANPEYLSQMDVYKPDEWELNRADIHLEEEIGRGSFGQVFLGYGDNCRSVLGTVFGECAVKTVAETASSAERLHFLVEASVMKQFDTSFIVKLYGVVSDGQPVLVVMELMKKVILLIIGVVIIILVICAIAIRLTFKKIMGEKIREIHQQISANPEYLSQMDVYKPDEWELNRADIHLEEEIGRGSFGQVFLGYGENCRSVLGAVFGECAVKTVAETASSAERLHFLVEASVMKQFDTSFIGNLRDYLRSRRPECDENIDNLPIPSEGDYIRWASQIADGMGYLEALKFCHPDMLVSGELYVRRVNCLKAFVNEFDTVKIGDFGMARDVYYHEYYRPGGRRLMPVRWLAPESLLDGKFTLKSDVWSYGIVLYEMLTLAQQPYKGIANDEVFDYIGVQKRIMAKPTECPDFWYDLMARCWKFNARDRPTFAQIVFILQRHAEEVGFHDEEFQECNKSL